MTRRVKGPLVVLALIAIVAMAWKAGAASGRFTFPDSFQQQTPEHKMGYDN